MKKKWVIIGIIVAVIFGGYMYIQGTLIQREREENVSKLVGEPLELDYIKGAAKIMKSKLPIVSEDGFILYDIQFDEMNREFTFFQQNKNIGNLTETEINDYQSNLKVDKKTIAKNSKNKDAFVEADVTIRYRVFDKNLNEVFNFIITPQDMK